MSRNGSGVYSLPSGNPVVSGTTVSSTWANNTLSDIASALTYSMSKDGQTTPTANLPMGGFKLTGNADGVADTDLLTVGQIADESGSDLVGFIQAVTGAVTTTVQAKLRESVSVDDFTGADPTGVADSYAALTNALATGKMVKLTNGGNYKCSGTLNFNGGKQLVGEGYGAGITYTGSGVGLLMTNAGNKIEGVALTTTAAATKGLHLLGASSNLVRDFSVTGNPANGIYLESTSTAAQTDWNTFENVTVNNAVLPVALVASGTGAVNANVFRGASNWRTSAVSGGVVLYLNGGGAGIIGNSFYDIDLSGYANNNSVVMDGPGTSQTNFIGIQVDSGSLTGCVIGAGVSATKWMGGSNQANTPFVRNNTATSGMDTLFTSSLNFNGSQQFANIGTASSGTVGNKNLLWYEEGTFVPTVFGTTGGAPLGYGAAVGTYTREGNRVIFDLYVSLTGLGTLTGNIRIGGLPFAAVVASGTQGCVSVGLANSFNAAVTNQILATISPGTPNIALYQFSAGNSTQITAANAATMVVLLSGSYQV